MNVGCAPGRHKSTHASRKVMFDMTIPEACGENLIIKDLEIARARVLRPVLKTS